MIKKFMLLMLFSFLVIMTACLSEDEIAVTYIVDEEVLKTEILSQDAIPIEPNKPTKEGYTFSGWRKINTNSFFSFETSVEEDTIFIATYDINSYELTMILNETTSHSITLPYNSKLAPLLSTIIPTKKGHRFMGWDQIPEIMPANNITITAQYEINNYDIIFVYNEEIIHEISVPYDTPLDLIEYPEVSEQGQKLIDWSMPPLETMPDYDLLVQPIFGEETYLLTYQDNEGAYLYVNTFEYGSSLESVIPPVGTTKYGHTFSHWSYELPQTMPAQDLSITPIFMPNNYKVTFYNADGYIHEQYTISYLENIPELSISDPNKPGYDFTGWETTLPETMPAEDIEIYPTFELVYELLDSPMNNDFYQFGSILGDANDKIMVGGGCEAYANTCTLYYYQLSDMSFVESSRHIVLYEDENYQFTRSLDDDINITMVDKNIPANNRTISMEHTYKTELRVSGNYFVLADPLDSDFTGVVYVYKFDDPTYERRISLIADGTAKFFGKHIFISNGYLIVSAPYNGTTSTNFYNGHGTIHVYSLMDESYRRTIKHSENESEYLGNHMVVYDNFIATFCDIELSFGMCIYRLDSLMYLREIDMSYLNVIPSMSAANDFLLLGDKIANKAYLYKFSEADFTYTLTPSDTREDIAYGTTVLLTSTQIVITAPLRDSKGAVYVYPTSDLNQERIIVSPLYETSASFGSEIVVIDQYIYISSPKAYENMKGRIEKFKLT